MASRLTLTLEVQVRICNLVSAGVPLPRATPMAGIPWNTAKKWARLGRDGVEPYVGYVVAIEAAKAAFTVGCVDKVQAKADVDWKAAAWMLERRDPHFRKVEGRKVEASVQHSGGVNLGALSKEDRQALRAILAKAR